MPKIIMKIQVTNYTKSIKTFSFFDSEKNRTSSRISLKPGVNELTPEQFDMIKNLPSYKQLEDSLKVKSVVPKTSKKSESTVQS